MITGERLRKLRESLKLTQSQVADMLNTDGNTISRWERGTLGIGRKRLISIAAALNTSVGYLIGETNDPEHKEHQKQVMYQIVKEKTPPEKQEPLNIAPFAAILDSTLERAKDTPHEQRVLIAQILRHTLEALEIPKMEDEEEPKFDGAARSA